MCCVFNGEGPWQAIAGRWTFASGCHGSINRLYRAGRSGCWLEKKPWHGTVGVGTLALRSTRWSAHIIGLRHDSKAGRSKVKDRSSRIREIVMPNDIEVLIAQDIGRRYWAGSTPRNGELERNIGEEIEDIWVAGRNAESIIQYSKRPDGLRSWCWISGVTCVVLQSWNWLSQLYEHYVRFVGRLPEYPVQLQYEAPFVHMAEQADRCQEAVISRLLCNSKSKIHSGQQYCKNLGCLMVPHMLLPA